MAAGLMDDFIRYVIILGQVPENKSSRATIELHIEHLRGLEQTGKLVLCGPFMDHPSGIVVVKASSRDEAEMIAKSDPFVLEGVRTYEIKTLKVACAQNNYLS